MYFEFETLNENPNAAKWRYIMAGILAIFLFLALSLRSVIPGIEKDIIERVSETFVNNGVSNIVISVAGQEVTLEGLVDSQKHAQVINLAQDVYGVTVVKDELTLTDKVRP